MAYEVLALKYRPKIFEDLVGQEAVTRTLTSAIQQGRIAHAFLFSGVRGVGKTTTARILAKALNCASGPTVRPCGECDACKEIARGGSLDVLEIDGASNNGVEQVREIIEASRYAPSRDRFKIYIIDEVHMLSTPAFNALLKTLEEPPPSVKFIFATTEHHKIPDTILSRCQEFEFRTVPPSEIALQLRKISDAEGVEVDDAAVAALARAAQGSLRDGISALDQVVAASGEKVSEADVTELLGLIERDVLHDTVRALVERDTEALLRTVDGLIRGGRDLRYFTSALMQYLRDVLVARVAPSAAELFEIPGESSELAELAQRLTEEDLLRSLDVLTQTEDALRTSPEPRFHLEVALLKLSQLPRLASFEELLARFEALATGGAPEAPPSRGGGPEKTPTRSAERRPSPPSKPLRSKPAASPSEASAPEASRGRDDQSGDDGGDWTRDVPPLGEGGASPETSSAAEADPEPASAEDSRDDLVARLVERLKTGKPIVHALVSKHARAEVGADRLVLFFRPEQRVLAEQLQQRELLALVEEPLEALAGRRLSVAVELAEPLGALPPGGGRGDSEGDTAASMSKSGPPEASPPPETESLRARAVEDPLVKRFVETFQGEVEEVRSPPRG